MEQATQYDWALIHREYPRLTREQAARELGGGLAEYLELVYGVMEDRGGLGATALALSVGPKTITVNSSIRKNATSPWLICTVGDRVRERYATAAEAVPVVLTWIANNPGEVTAAWLRPPVDGFRITPWRRQIWAEMLYDMTPLNEWAKAYAEAYPEVLEEHARGLAIADLLHDPIACLDDAAQAVQDAIQDGGKFLGAQLSDEKLEEIGDALERAANLLHNLKP